MNELRLVPITQSFTTRAPNGRYLRLICQFVDSNEKELGVEATNISTAYAGLIRVVNEMGLQDKIKVKRHNGEVHLIRVE